MYQQSAIYSFLLLSFYCMDVPQFIYINGNRIFFIWQIIHTQLSGHVIYKRLTQPYFQRYPYQDLIDQHITSSWPQRWVQRWSHGPIWSNDIQCKTTEGTVVGNKTILIWYNEKKYWAGISGSYTATTREFPAWG